VGSPPGTIERIATELAGGSGAFRRWFAANVRGTDEVDVERALGHVGLELVPGQRRAGAALGVELSGASIRSVVEDGPAAGVLSPGDELLALDGERIEPSALGDRLRDLAPGHRVLVTLSRDGRIVEAALQLGAPPVSDLKIRPAGATNGKQQALYRGWMSLRA
jgi:predicted metalloprotease with PDZ domain